MIEMRERLAIVRHDAYAGGPRKNTGSEIDKTLREKIDNPIVSKHLNTGSESILKSSLHNLQFVRRSGFAGKMPNSNGRVRP